MNLAEAVREKTVNRLSYEREFFYGGFAPISHCIFKRGVRVEGM
jgi:hypothetical protein